ncbi:MAG: twin-arginine translocase TatA/TatE family subunit [Anaerolineae bacterium]|nr:twin-arginine translocase TatA/TatE family subunit [Anaerolineae bacterium]
MNILGVGGPELVIILVLMLIIAGPKRMLHWSYILGQYVAKFRRMWSETVDVLQKEFDDAGVDFQIPKDPPSRGSLNREAAKMLGNVTKPVKDTLDQVNTEVGDIKKTTAVVAQSATTTVRGGNGHAPARPAAVSRSTSASRKSNTNPQETGFGSWSSHDAKPGFGSWTTNGQQPDDEE